MADIRYTITDLGILPGFTNVSAKAINDRGQIIGELRKGLKSVHSFLWDSGRMHPVGEVTLNGINNHGQAIGTEYSHRQGHASFQAVIFHEGKVRPLLADDSLLSFATSINDSGQVVGHTSVDPQTVETAEELQYEGFVWHDGGRRELLPPPGHCLSRPVAVNNKGVVVGSVMRSHTKGPIPEQAVLWDGDAVILLGSLPGYEESKAIAINNRRQVLVQATCGSRQWEVMKEIERRSSAAESSESVAQYEADNYWRLSQPFFIWENGHMREITGRSARAINDHGQVVGSTGWSHNDVFDCDGRIWAFLWQDGKMTDLNPLIPPDAGWDLRYANDINNHGQIVGNGLHNGNERAFLLTPKAS